MAPKAGSCPKPKYSGDTSGGEGWLMPQTEIIGDARNDTFKERVVMSPYQAMYGEKKDVSDFRAFGCRAWVYLDKQRRVK